MKTIRLFFLLLIFPLIVSAQSDGTKGTEFWFTYMENLDLIFNGDPQFSVFVSAETSGTATISAPATGLELTFDYEGGELTEYVLPPAIFYGEGSEEIENFGLKLVTSTAANVFTIHFRAYFTEGSIVLPTEMLGTAYVISAALDVQNNSNSPSSFVIVSTQDGTEISITPSALTLGLRPAGITFDITLDEGQSYQVQGLGDLTGSRVEVNGDAPIAVFGGAKQGDIGCDEFADNHLYDQLYPENYASKQYALIPFNGQGGSVFKVVALENNTDVLLNGVLWTTLQEGEFVEQLIESPSMLTSSNEVHVTQFNPSQACNASNYGDPNMLQLCDVDYRFRSKINFEHFIEYLNNPVSYLDHNLTLFTETENLSQITLNGEDIVDQFLPFPGNQDYSYALIGDLGPGSFELNAPRGIQAYVYGFGDFDAYTYHLGFDPENSTSVDALSFETLSVFPNPFVDALNITATDKIDKVEVFNANGIQLFDQSIDQSSFKLDLADLPNGMYILKLLKGDQFISKRIIKAE